MKRLARHHWPMVVALVAGASIAVLAVVDHRAKQERAERAEVSEWYCKHRGTRCHGRSSSRIEARWNTRENAYEVALVGLAAFVTVQIVLRRRDAVRRSSS